MTKKGQILVVDDSMASLSFLTDVLKAEGYTVRSAINGNMALDSIATKLPELILLDINMPDLDGFQVCRRLKQQAFTRDIPVIFLSGLSDTLEILKGFKLGAVDYITKPFHREELLARVNTHLELNRLRCVLKEMVDGRSESLRKLKEAHVQLKLMNVQFLQSEKLASVGLLAAGVAHEINNPIGFVNSNLSSLREYVSAIFHLLDEHERLEAIAPIALQQQFKASKQQANLDFLRQDIDELINESLDGTTRVKRIVQDLLDFSKPSESEFRQVDLQQVLESTLNIAWNSIKNKANVLRDYTDLPLVECRPAQINQVFLNLLLNAAQAIPENGLITLQTRSDSEWVRIAICDNGSGIAPEHCEKIFDPFFTTKPVGQGTGLGLSISYGIVTNHGGRIEVNSEIGVGSTFTLWLPISQKKADSLNR